MKTSRLLPIAFCLTLLLLPGCGQRETDAEAGIRTKTLLVSNGAEPASLDPQLVNLYLDTRLLYALFEGLTATDEKSAKPVPATAERWDVSADGLVYTFHLRPTARWSNGDPVTARDFAFAFERSLLPRLGSPGAYMLWAIKNAAAFNAGKVRDFSAVGVEAVDATTLRLTLERPTPYLPALAASYAWFPVHRRTIEKFGSIDDRTSPWTRPGNLVGNGPFTLAEWRPNDRIVVTKNFHYWDTGHNQLERIIFFPIENPDVEERAFRAGQVHIINQLPTAKIAGYRARDPAKLRIDPFLATDNLGFNVERPPLDRPKVRRALSLAIDREAIVRTAFAGAHRPAASYVPPGCGGYAGRAQVPTDYAAARRLLVEAGLPGGKGLPEMAVLVGGNSSDNTRSIEVIQETWRRELGVRVRVEAVELKMWLQSMQTHDYTITYTGWSADFADPVNFLDVYVTKGGNNWTGWGNPDYDRLIADAARTPEPAARFEFFQQAEALLLAEAPIAPLYFKAQPYLIHPTVKNWEPAPLGYHRFQYVSLER